MGTRRAIPALLAAGALAAVLVACGDGGAGEETVATLPTLAPSGASTTTTVAAATTTLAPSTLPPPTAATTPPVPVWPLTGLPGGEDPRAQLPALVVKIDNHPNARPQVGLGQADVVYEEIVEGITRFFAVFHSTGSDPIGPVRSARTTDIDLLRQLGRPLFAWSGANNGTINALRAADVATDVGAAFNYGPGGWYRQPGRRAPWNLFSTTSRLWSLTPAGLPPPVPLFTFRAPGVAPNVVPVAGAKLTMAGTRVMWLWDANAQAWVRIQDDRPHTDVNGALMAPQNVVVLFVPYVRSSADPLSPEAITVGEGDAWVFTGGGVVSARWQRPDPTKPAVLVDGAGAVIPLTPGRTWVELSRIDGANLVEAGADPAAVPYPPR